ncbi:hypothetical protein A9986_02755 [Solibacillus silvestris]|nr:hypothetical protein A9986_02755 [Solibacillus silvestris]
MQIDWNEGEATPAGTARGRAIGTKAKNATSCGNAFVTNIVLASGPRKASDPEWKSTSEAG